MPFATWWRGDALPDLAPLPTFSVRRETDTQSIMSLTHLSKRETNLRIQNGNLFSVAFVDDTPVAYGWIATREGGISGFHFSFPIPAKNCYLWDFSTLPEWRGRSIYPRLLQTIIQQELLIERFWIGYEPGNKASARGMTKAGFHVVSDFVISEGRILGLSLLDSSEYAKASANFFHLPIIAAGT
jgi:GNAT superfamily N-acetyltransferase